MKVVCCECDRKRDPYRPVVQLSDGKVLFVCKHCWVAFDYCNTSQRDAFADPTVYVAGIMFDDMSPADLQALRRAKH